MSDFQIGPSARQIRAARAPQTVPDVVTPSKVLADYGLLPGEDLAKRIKMIARLVPDMRDDMDVMLAQAQAYPDYADMLGSAEGMAAFSTARDQAKRLMGLKGDRQRQQWDAGTPEQRRAWVAAGFVPGGNENAAKATMGLSGFSGPLSAAARGIGRGLGIAVAPIRKGAGEAVEALGKPLGAVAHATRTGLYLAQQNDEGAGSEGRKGLVDAWRYTTHGEEAFRPAAQRDALDALGGNEEAYLLAKDMADGDQIEDIVARNLGDDFLDPAYQEEVQRLGQIIEGDPDAFNKARSIMAKGKISFGRSLALGLGTEASASPGFDIGTLVSGLGDAIFSLSADPLLVAGKVRKASLLRRYASGGVDNVASDVLRAIDAPKGMSLGQAVGDLVGRAARREVTNPWDKGYTRSLLNADLNAGERWYVMAADHVRHGATWKMTEYGTQYSGVIGSLTDFDNVRRAQNLTELGRAQAGGRLLEQAAEGTPGIRHAGDVIWWLTGGDGAAAMMKGQLGSYRTWGIATLPRMTATQVRAARAKVAVGKSIDVLRAEDGIPLLRNLASKTEQATRTLPRLDYQDLDLEGPSLMNLARWLRIGEGRADTDQIMEAYIRAGSLEQRDAVYRNATAIMFRDLGFYDVPGSPAAQRADELLYHMETARYAATPGLDVIEEGGREIRAGISLYADASSRRAMPAFGDLVDMARANHKMGLIRNRSDHAIDAFQQRYWKPAVLLRLGFIPRAAGEEALNYLVQFGPKALATRWFATPLASKSEHDPLFGLRSVSDHLMSWLPEETRRDILAGKKITGAQAMAAKITHDFSAYVRGMARRHVAPFESVAAAGLHYQGKIRTADEKAKGITDAEIAAEVAAGGDLSKRAQAGMKARDLAARAGEDAAVVAREVFSDPEVAALAWMIGVHPAVQRAHVQQIAGHRAFYDPTRDDTRSLRTIVLGRHDPQEVALRTVGSSFEEVAQSTETLSSHYNRLLPLADDPVHRFVNQRMANYIDREASQNLFERFATGDPTIDSPRELVMRLRAAYRKGDFGVQEATSAFINGQRDDLVRGVNLGAMDHVDRSLWLRLNELSPDLDPGTVAMLAVPADWEKGFDPGELDVLLDGDQGSYRAVVTELSRRQLRDQSHAEQLKKMTRSRLAGGRERDVIPEGHERYLSPMLNHQDSARLGSLNVNDIDPDLPGPVRTAVASILSTVDDNGFWATSMTHRASVGNVVDPVKWATIDPELADNVAYELSRLLGRDEIPLGFRDVNRAEDGVASRSSWLYTTDTEGKVVRIQGPVLGRDQVFLEPHVAFGMKPFDFATDNEVIDAYAHALSGKHIEMFGDHTTGGHIAELVHGVARGEMSDGLMRRVNVDQLGPLAIRPVTFADKPSTFRQAIINYGFDRVIGPAIDAIIRKPRFLHAAGEAWRDVQPYVRRLEDARLEEQIAGIATRLGMDKVELRNHWRAVPDELKSKLKMPIKDLLADERVSPALRTLDDKLGYVLKPSDVGLLRSYERYRVKLEADISNIVASRAVNDVVPYIDDHRIRTELAERGRHVVPFWFAQEQFIKRWYTTFQQDPSAARRLELYFHGFWNSPIVEDDQFGGKMIVYHGTEYFTEVVAKGLKHIGIDVTLPYYTPFAGDAKHLLPGFDDPFGNPGLGPAFSIPVGFASQRVPELRPLLGRGADNAWYQQLLPTWMNNLIRGFTADPEKDVLLSRYLVGAAAYMEGIDQARDAEAIAKTGEHMPAEDRLTPGDTATNDEIERYQAHLENYARHMVFAQTILGTALPSSPRGLDPGEGLRSEYRRLITTYGFDEGVAEYLKRHPHDTAYTIFANYSKSKASINPTKATGEFLERNAAWVGKYQYASGYFLPQAPTGSEGYDRDAWRQAQALGLVGKRSTNELFRAIRFQTAARPYFAMSDEYEARRAATQPGSDQRRDLAEKWKLWSTQYRANHPIFAEELESGTSRVNRDRILREMDLALADPELPSGSESVVSMHKMFRAFQNRLASLGDRRTKQIIAARKDLRTKMAYWGQVYSEQNPQAEPYWLRVVLPELRLSYEENQVLEEATG